MEGSTAITGTAAPTGVTSFANEACEAVEINKSFVSSSITTAQPDLQDIKGYFARPRLILRGTLPFGLRDRRAGIIINNTQLVQYFPQWADRLSGVFGIRFKMNFRLQVAATPFHQGVLSLGYQYGTDGNANNTVYYNRSSSSCSATNLPHVRLDISETTMVELMVPFIYEKEYAAVDVTSTEQLGYLSLNVILPLQSVTGLPAPTYELYMFLTDIELFGADNNRPTTITLQSGLSTFGSELKEARVLSKGLAGASKAATFVAGAVPSLSSFAGPVAWALGTASGIAKYLGFSRPLLQDPVMRVLHQQYASESNVDVPMAGFSCGLMQSNTLEISPEVGGTDVDEMSLEFLTTQWSQACVGSIATTNVHNNVVYAGVVSPSAFWFRAPPTRPFCNIPFPSGNTTGATWNSIMPTSLMNVASYFRLWRGDFKFRITFAKTKFHGGRYMVSFNPKTDFQFYAGSPVTTIDGPEQTAGVVQPYGYSKIMDLRDGNVFEFEVPYMSAEPYLHFNSSIGGISIVCIDPLLDNPSVCSTVPFLVEVCGSNFELADYAGPWFAQIPGGTIREQSGDVILASTVNKASPITVGERIMSVKQLIQAPSWFQGTLAVGANKYVMVPWFYSRSTSYFNNIIATPLPTTVAISGNTISSNIAKLYAFVRGGTDHHLYCPYGNGTAMIYEQTPFQANMEYSSGFKDLSIRQTNSSCPKVVALGTTPLHVRAPAFQNRVRVRSTALDNYTWSVLGSGLSGGLGVRSHTDRVTVINDTQVQPVWYSKAAADDATLAQYQGPVPLAILNSGQADFPDKDWYRS